MVKRYFGHKELLHDLSELVFCKDVAGSIVVHLLSTAKNHDDFSSVVL